MPSFVILMNFSSKLKLCDASAVRSETRPKAKPETVVSNTFRKPTQDRMDDKIENNPSFQEFGKNIKGIKAIKQIASFLAPFSKTAKNISNSLDGFHDLEKQFNELSKSPDLFNHYFSELGWIAHESMNQDLMLECIELASKNERNEAEEKLADYYTSDNLKWLSSQLKGTPEFQKKI